VALVRFAQVIPRQSRRLIHERFDLSLVAIDTFEIAIPHGEAGLNLGGQHFQFGAENSGLGMQQVVERAGCPSI
jgi:hypothetical protein